MPILHISLTEQNQSINLNSDLNAQMLTLKKACVATANVGSGRTLKGGVAIEFPFLTGAEVVSSKVKSNSVIIPFDEHNTEKYAEVRFDSDLQAEHIPRSFIVRTKNFEDKLIKFEGATKGEITSRIEQIDLFFEYKTSHKFF